MKNNYDEKDVDGFTGRNLSQWMVRYWEKKRQVLSLWVQRSLLLMKKQLL